jgi:hypothetical protein
MTGIDPPAEAIRLADALELDPMPLGWYIEAGAELRRLHAENERLRAEAEGWKLQSFEQHRDADRAIMQLVAMRNLAALALRTSEPGIALIALQSMLPNGPGREFPALDESRLAAIRRLHDAIDRIWSGESADVVYTETLREAPK